MSGATNIYRIAVFARQSPYQLLIPSRVAPSISRVPVALLDPGNCFHSVKRMCIPVRSEVAPI